MIMFTDQIYSTLLFLGGGVDDGRFIWRMIDDGDGFGSVHYTCRCDLKHDAVESSGAAITSGIVADSLRDGSTTVLILREVLNGDKSNSINSSSNSSCSSKLAQSDGAFFPLLPHHSYVTALLRAFEMACTVLDIDGEIEILPPSKEFH